MSDSGNANRIDYPREGFTIFLDGNGLRIQVVDYHAETLQLSWEMILAFAKRANAVPAASPSTTDAL